MGFHQQSLEISRKVNNRFGQCNALAALGLVAYHLSNVVEAMSYHQLALAIAREMGDCIRVAECLGNLGQARFAAGDWELPWNTIRRPLRCRERPATTT